MLFSLGARLHNIEAYCMTHNCNGVHSLVLRAEENLPEEICSKTKDPRTQVCATLTARQSGLRCIPAVANRPPTWLVECQALFR